MIARSNTEITSWVESAKNPITPTPAMPISEIALSRMRMLYRGPPAFHGGLCVFDGGGGNMIGPGPQPTHFASLRPFNTKPSRTGDFLFAPMTIGGIALPSMTPWPAPPVIWLSMTSIC